MPHFTFQKDERLKREKVIQSLFRKGESFGQYPLRLVWLLLEDRQGPFPVQFALSVPKKAFPKAVDRNRIRRRIREAYRLNKHRLYERLEGEEVQYAFMVIYTAKETLPFQEIETALQKMIHRFLKYRNSPKKTTNSR